MSTKSTSKGKTAAASSSAAGYDLEAFIEARRELTVPVMFKRADDLLEQLEDLARQRDEQMGELHAKRERLQGAPDVERGLDEPSLDQLELLISEAQTSWDGQIREVEDQWDDRAQQVTVREATDREFGAITADLVKRARQEAKGEVEPGEVPAGVQMMLRQIELALVEPRISADDLWTIYSSSVIGEAAVEQIADAVREVRTLPSGPFSRASSPPPSGQGSAPS